ncbi:hypothetical protein LXA43DRAFT_1057618 [Ganoderma leucocontextum]|nr:hypothetical protein LXA43DRAFT_1057618 [Ganoderma leucocontextum]
MFTKCQDGEKVEGAGTVWSRTCSILGWLTRLGKTEVSLGFGYVVSHDVHTRLFSKRSFDDIPPFPAERNPRVFLNDLGLAGQPSAAQRAPATPLRAGDASHSLVSSLTAPRPRVILVEKASVHSWVTSDDSHSDYPNGASDREPAKDSDSSARGHPTSPDLFHRTQRGPFSSASPTVTGIPPAEPHYDMALVDLPDVTSASMNPVTAPCTPMSRPGGSTAGVPHKDSPSGLLLVPTIMVSNSTAALALSLESSSNLHSHQDLPLAIRRGKKPPPALSLDQPEKPSMPESADSNSYPDIPSAFLGSSPTSPSFNGVNAREPSRFDMGLSTMCSNLKALVPPPPFTPTEAEHQPPSHPPPSLEPDTRWGMTTAAQLPDANDEEWRFVQDLIVEWHESNGHSAEVGPPASPPPHTVAYTGIELPTTDAPSKGSPAPTATGSRSDDNKPNVDVQQPLAQTPPSVKQARRKTVIIQAPDGDIQIAPGDAERPAKTGKLCSPPGDRSIDFLLDEFDEPVPFEIPSSVPLSAPASFEGSFFTPPNSRPSSTASSAGLPIRGILKEKKSVRFSAVPSLYEYATAMNDDFADRPGTPSKHHSDLDVLSALKRIPVPPAATTRTPSRSSPLRKMQTHPHSSGSHGPEEAASDVTTPHQVPSGSAAMPTTSAPAPMLMTPPRSAPPTCRSRDIANNTSPSTTVRIPTMAKHPAVRALAHKPSPSRPPGLPSPLVGSGAGGAVVGAPTLQSPYPTMSSPPKNQDQRRTPLKTISANARQNTANMVERKPSAASSSPVKQPQATPRTGRKDPVSHTGPKGKESVGLRASQMASRSSLEHERGEALTPSTRRRSAGVSQLRVENACGGTSADAGTVGSQSQRNSSRMPVPLRSIFTKLRAA